MKQILFIFLVVSFSFTYGQGNVRVLDFVFLPEMNAYNFDASNDSIDVRFQFKVSEPFSSYKAHIYLGTQPGSSDVLQIAANFINQGGTYFLSYMGKEFSIHNYDGYFVARIPKVSFNAFSVATLFVETINNGNTLAVYTNK